MQTELTDFQIHHHHGTHIKDSGTDGNNKLLVGDPKDIQMTLVELEEMKSTESWLR